MADSSIVERQRQCHEEKERLIDAMMKEVVHPKKTVCPFSLFLSCYFWKVIEPCL